MRLFVIGATGSTGTHIVDLALGRGHQVTAFVRSPRKLAARDRLSIVGGDPLRTEAVAASLPGHDAVLSTLGPPFREAMRPSTLLTDCAASAVAAMTSVGVRRLAMLSAAVLFSGGGLQLSFVRWLLRHHARDLVTAEAVVTASSLEWTIARPPRLVQSSAAAYRAERDGLPPDFRATSFRAVAAFMLDTVERSQHVRQVMGVSR
jgi:putative NADH-flavin reductase